MPYEITIVKTELVRQPKKPNWQQVDDKGNYGYPPRVEVEEEVTQKIFVQRVDELNLSNVIKAVNGL